MVLISVSRQEIFYVVCDMFYIFKTNFFSAQVHIRPNRKYVAPLRGVLHRALTDTFTNIVPDQ